MEESINYNSLQKKQDERIFYFNGYILNIYTDKITYKACMTDKCKKKVNLMPDGFYRCDVCNKNFNGYNPTYMFCVIITDYTSSIHVNFTREHGNDIFGKF